MAIEYVPYIGDEFEIHPFRYLGRLGDSEVLVEVVGTDESAGRFAARLRMASGPGSAQPLVADNVRPVSTPEVIP